MTGQYFDNGDILVDHYWGDEDSIESALFDAFDSMEVDLMDRSPLYEHLDVDAVRSLLEVSQSVICIVARVWNFPVEITRKQIQVYAQAEH